MHKGGANGHVQRLTDTDQNVAGVQVQLLSDDCVRDKLQNRSDYIVVDLVVFDVEDGEGGGLDCCIETSSGLHDNFGSKRFREMLKFDVSTDLQDRERSGGVKVRESQPFPEIVGSVHGYLGS